MESNQEKNLAPKKNLDVRIIKYEHSNKEHKEKLVKFWNLMTSNEPLPEIITRRWSNTYFPTKSLNV